MNNNAKGMRVAYVLSIIVIVLAVAYMVASWFFPELNFSIGVDAPESSEVSTTRTPPELSSVQWAPDSAPEPAPAPEPRDAG